MRSYTARIKRHEWTPEEDKLILTQYGPLTSSQLATKIGVSPAAVLSRIRKLTDERKK